MSADPVAPDALFAMLYHELRRLAQRELGRQGHPISVSATTLLHQAYIEMSARNGAAFPARAAFMTYAARVMRGLIIDHARERGAIKRGGQFEITSFTDQTEYAADPGELIELSDALDQLAVAEPALAEIVDLKYFCGFTFSEIAAMQSTTERTVQRHWEKARIYLHHSLSSIKLD